MRKRLLSAGQVHPFETSQASASECSRKANNVRSPLILSKRELTEKASRPRKAIIGDQNPGLRPSQRVQLHCGSAAPTRPGEGSPASGGGAGGDAHLRLLESSGVPGGGLRGEGPERMRLARGAPGMVKGGVASPRSQSPVPPARPPPPRFPRGRSTRALGAGPRWPTPCFLRGPP